MDVSLAEVTAATIAAMIAHALMALPLIVPSCWSDFVGKFSRRVRSSSFNLMILHLICTFAYPTMLCDFLSSFELYNEHGQPGRDDKFIYSI